MRPRFPSIIIFLALAIVQATAGELVSIYGIKPSFIIVTVYALSITGGEWRGLAYGALGGFVEDCLSGGYMGLFLSAYAVVGFLAGRLGKKVFNIGESANFGGIFMLSLASGFYVSAILEALHGGEGIFGQFFRFALPQAFYNACAGAVILWLFKDLLDKRAPWLKVIRQLGVRI